MNLAAQELRQQPADAGSMDLDTHKLGGWIGFGHLHQTVAHAKANFDNASACEAESLIPVEAPALQRETKLGKALLPAALTELDDRSRDILERRWLADDKATLHELAAEYEVSAERIRQLEANAMKKLRTAMAS